MIKKKLLIALPLPPPYSGQERFTQSIIECGIEKYSVVHFDTSLGHHAEDRGKFGCKSCLKAIVINIKYIYWINRYRPAIVIHTLARNRMGFIRSGMIIAIGKLSGAKTIALFLGEHFGVFYLNCGRLLKSFIKLVLWSIDIMIVQADYIKEEIKFHFPNLKYKKIYSYLDQAYFQYPENKKKLESADKASKVLFVGYRSKAKGAFDLLAAIPSIIECCPDTRFLFIGDELKKERNLVHLGGELDLRLEWAEIIKKYKLEKHIEVHTGIDNATLKSIYLTSDILVLPSYSEGFPFAILEGMLAGLPLIATRVGALGEVLVENENVLFVPKGRADILAEKIIILLKNPGIRICMGANNRRLALEKFNTIVLKNELESICSELA